MLDLKKGDRVWVLVEEESQLRQPGTITGDGGYTDQMTAVWMVRLDGVEVDVAVPGKLLEKIPDPENA